MSAVITFIDLAKLSLFFTKKNGQNCRGSSPYYFGVGNMSHTTRERRQREIVRRQSFRNQNSQERNKHEPVQSWWSLGHVASGRIATHNANGFAGQTVWRRSAWSQNNNGRKPNTLSLASSFSPTRHERRHLLFLCV